MSGLHRAGFHLLRHLGRPFGGVRPRRIYHWLAHRAWPTEPRDPAEFRWFRDRWDHRFLLHPYYQIDREIIAFGSYDPSLMRFLHARLQPGMVCMDVGANLGLVTVNMATAVAPGGTVHSFEPIPSVRQRLEGHVRANGLEGSVVVHPVALSNASGTAQMRYAGASVDNQGMGSLVDEANPWLDRLVDVSTTRLDDFVNEQGIDRLDWMKIDIQGAEPMLLEGGGRTLTELSPDLLVEVAPRGLAAVGTTSRELLLMIEALGYRLFCLDGSEVGRALDAADVPDDFVADNVYCTKKA